jgi:DNA-binding IclR family transcriptional regulator
VGSVPRIPGRREAPAPGVQVLDRSVAVLDAVATRGPLTLADLTAATGLPRATAHRLALALERHGLLARDGAGRFVLGGRIVGWGAIAARTDPIVAHAPAVLARLRDGTGESAQLYVREGDRRVCVATAERATGLRDTVPLGAALPLDAGSGARVLLAWADDAARFRNVTPSDLAAVRRRGWAETVGEREAGVASVSAPVRGADGAVVAAISVSGPIERMGRDPGRRLARAVVGAARDLETAAGRALDVRS